MTKKRLLLYIILASLLVFGCRLGSLLDPAGEYGIDRNNAIYLSGGQPRTMDPALTLGGPDDALGHIFSGLMALDANLQIQPELAAGWEVSDDGLVYTFYLRQDAVFHDGRPLTAQDVVYSWERAADPALGSDTARTYLGDIAGFTEKLDGQADTISGLRVIDDHTLEVTLREPVVYFLSKLAYPVGYVVDQNNVSQNDWEHQPNGSGPFKLLEWRDDEIIVLARNELYYGDLPQIGHLVYSMGAGIPMSLYETGEIDMVGIGSSTLERAQDPNDPLSDEVQLAVSMCTSTIGLNTAIAPFDDMRVRQAFNYALDKNLIIGTFYGGNALPAKGSLPPGMPGYTGTNEGYPFNPEKARQLLAEAGYPNGEGFPTLTYSTSGYGDVGDYVTAVITLWQENLGVTIEPVVIDPYIFYDELYAGNVGNLYGSGWCADYPDPQNFLDILYHSDSPQNIGRFSNPEIDALLEQARIEPDVTQRMALYADIEQMIIEQAPTVFTVHGIDAVLVKPYVKNYKLAPIGVRQWHQVGIGD